MHKDDILKVHQSILKHLLNNNIIAALRLLRKQVGITNFDSFFVVLSNNEDTYNLVLQYAIKGVVDSQREDVVRKIIKSLIELNDKVKIHLLDKLTSYSSGLKKAVLAQSKLIFNKVSEINDDINLSKELNELLSEIEIDTESLKDDLSDNKLINDIFYYVWLKENFNEQDVEMVQAFLMNKNINTNQKALVISGMTLSLMDVFDEKKILLLTGLIGKTDILLHTRIMVGLMVAMYLYDNILEFYPRINEELEKNSFDESLDTFIGLFLIQMVKAKDTDRFTKRFKEEIMPEIIKNAPKIQERLELDNILPDDSDEDKNPDWQKLLEKTPDLMRKLEELSKLQLEGTDVFMSTFAMLKGFPFFQTLTNWLIPFYKENGELQRSMASEDQEFRDTFLLALEKSGHMCNSDKYSFCFNLHALPATQKKVMLQMFKAELENINELINDDSKVDFTLQMRSLVTQYIQDMYRFFKLHPFKQEFNDIFNHKLDFYNKNFFKKHFYNESNLIRLGDFYFDNEHYSEAIDVYHLLIEKGINTQIIFEKMGFAYQKKKLFSEAIDFYKRAELFETNAWINMKIAYCYTALNNYKEALFYYHEAEKNDSENLKIQLQIANAYLKLGDIEVALNHYYKLELLADTNVKVLRPITWCLFVLQRLDEAAYYFETLIKSTAVNSYDYMNYGHWLWASGKMEAAAEAYLKSISLNANNFKFFLKTFKDDKIHLLNNGVKVEDIELMINYIDAKREEL